MLIHYIILVNWKLHIYLIIASIDKGQTGITIWWNDGSKLMWTAMVSEFRMDKKSTTAFYKQEKEMIYYST